MAVPQKTGKIIKTVFPYFVIVGLIIMIFGAIYIYQYQTVTSPEQTEQVEVIGKRITEHRSGGGKYSRSRTYYTFIIAFKFSDGSIKELSVGINSQKKDGERHVYCTSYEALHEGDTGILTYKEIENIEEKIKRENMLFDGREFISFKKDTPSGEVILFSSPPMTEEYFELIFLSISLAIVIIPVLSLLFRFNINPFMKKNVQQVELINKRVELKTTFFTNYIASFKFPDGTVREFRRIKSRKTDKSSKDIRHAHKGNKGMLTYKEIKNIKNKIKNESKQWKGRVFISFEKDSKLDK